jgi:hypothetical protein
MLPIIDSSHCIFWSMLKAQRLFGCYDTYFQFLEAILSNRVNALLRLPDVLLRLLPSSNLILSLTRIVLLFCRLYCSRTGQQICKIAIVIIVSCSNI